MKLTGADLLAIIDLLGQQAADDIEWAEALCPPLSADDFALDVIFVICNSGMKNTVARAIYHRVRGALEAGVSVQTVFGHIGKATAIACIWRDRDHLFAEYMAATDKLAFAKSLPWIGGITAFHVVKNFGADVAKPDVHLQRLADLEGVTPQQLCARLSRETGYRIATVDTLLWRASANGVLNSRTGEIAGRRAALEQEGE